VHYRTQNKEPTAAMEFGSAVDCLILTPDQFESKFCAMPDGLKKPTAAQINAKKPSDETLRQIEAYNAFMEANKGKTWLSQEDLALAKFLAEKTFENEKAKDLLSRVSRTQDRLSWQHKETGFPMIGYKDITGDTFIADLKTAADGSPDGFMRKAIDFGYHIQAAIYLDGEKTIFGRFPDFYWLVVETSEPYNISVFKATQEFIQYGVQEYEHLMQSIKFCADNNLWHMGYEFHTATGYHSLDLPGYFKHKLNK